MNGFSRRLGNKLSASASQILRKNCISSRRTFAQDGRTLASLPIRISCMDRLNTAGFMFMPRISVIRHAHHHQGFPFLANISHFSSKTNGGEQVQMPRSHNDNDKTRSRSFDVKNNFAAHHKHQEKHSDKLREILNGIGMSISQWKIKHDSDSEMNMNIKSSARDDRENTKVTNGNGVQTKAITKRRTRRPHRHNEFTSTLVDGYLGSGISQPQQKHSAKTYYNRPRKSRSQAQTREEFDVYNYYDGPSYYPNSHSHRNRSRRKRNHNHNLEFLGDEISYRLSVNSVYAASNVDITTVLKKVFGSSSDTPAVRHMFGKMSVMIELPPVLRVKNPNAKNDPSGATKQNLTNSNTTTTTSTSPDAEVDEFFYSKLQQPLPRYVAIFRYGSIVFFNISPKIASHILEQVKKCSIEPIPHGNERREQFEIAISPRMEATAHVNADFATVQQLNMNNVAIVSTIMGQTVAFDSYNDTVDELLSRFATINSAVKRTGNFTDMEKETLFRVVAQNNSMFIDMIAKLGIKDRSDMAWNLSQYERLHEGMKEEFEIEPRFDDIEFKLNLIQQNAKFFLEILHNQKSDTLEWIIIVLIGFECVLMILDMSGAGATLLQSADMLKDFWQ